MPTVPAGKLVVVIVTPPDPPEIVIESGFESVVGVGVVESCTCIVKLDVPAVVGVPEIVAPDKFKPAGKLPAIRLQVYGRTPPVAVKVAL